MKQQEIKIGTNKSFGFVFFVIFIVIALWPLLNDGNIRIWSVILSLVFLILGFLNSKILTPLNKLWFKFGKLLGFIVAPIVMGVIFFLIITPTGFIMKMLGKDLLNKKYNNKIKSYWINREKSKSTMKQQF